MKKLLPIFVSFAIIPTALAQDVKVYTYESFASDWGPAPALKQSFEKKYPSCNIQYQDFDSRNIIVSRLLIEKERTTADVVIGIQDLMVQKLDKLHIFEKINKPKSINLPENSIDNPYFVPYDFGEFAFIYDKNKLKNPPKSLKELFEREDIRVIYQDPRTSGVGRSLVIWANQVFGDQADTYFKKLAKHTTAVGKGWSESYGAFLKGQSDVVLSYNTSPLYHLLSEQKDNYDYLTLNDAKVLEVELAALIKGKNNQCAKDFVNFLVTPQGQKQIATKNVMLPVIDNVEPYFDRLKQATLSGKHFSHPSLQNVEKWVNNWQKVILGQ